MLMKWISVFDRLPGEGEEVLVCIKYSGEDHWAYTLSQIGDGFCLEPNSSVSWLMGSAEGYVISHWMYIENPHK